MKFENNSPWLAQLERSRALQIIDSSKETDLLIIGGGIAGVMTAYFLLKNTKKKVMLIEGNKIAHGATGHNAGQIASYFERPFSNLVEEYGLKLASEAQKDILSAWPLIQEIHKKAKIKTPLVEFTGYAGCSSLNQLEEHLENKYLRKKAGINFEEVLIDKDFDLKKINSKYKNLYSIVPRSEIINRLETKDNKYFAALGSRKGLVNSAVFIEELAGFLIYNYKKRFNIFEHSKVEKVKLYSNRCEAVSGGFKIYSKKIILCTNGFESIKIENEFGSNIDTKFHEYVSGLIGYMAGYQELSNKKPLATSFFLDKKYRSVEQDSYFYVTRRKFELKNKKSNLVCVGGPEKKLQEGQTYLRDHPYFDIAEKEISDFFKKTYESDKKIMPLFKWHGLMGYTKNKLRIIGPEPCNRNLLYNLGCNGVGILASTFGAKKISQFVNNKVKKKSIFDPFNSQCSLN